MESNSKSKTRTKSRTKSKARSRTRARSKSSKNRIPTIIGIIAVIIVIAYLGTSFYFSRHYFPGTSVDGIDIGMMTTSTAADKIATATNEYELIITDRENNTFKLSGADFNMQFNDNSYLSDILKSQSPLAWISGLTSAGDHTYDFSNCYSASDLEAAISNLEIFADSYQRDNVDAGISYSESDKKFEITPEQLGTVLIKENVISDVTAAVNAMSLNLTLTDDDYVAPAYTSESSELTSALDTANGYLGTTITYELGDDYSEVLDADTISSWVTISDDFSVNLDTDKLTSYVQSLASKYNTYADKREFKTALGDTITIGGGDYGWVIDKTKEAEQIKEDLAAGGDISREPVYSQTALYRGKDDIGSTYIEIDYTNQHLYYFEKGELKLDCDIVSGNISNGNGSPDGVFKIVYKQRDATLVGENYSSDVSYFMPFAYNVGIHDASWRSEFGGDIYKKSGSHGCINCPLKVVKQLYDMVATGTPVIAYYRDSIKLSSQNAYISNAYSYVAKDK